MPPTIWNDIWLKFQTGRHAAMARELERHGWLCLKLDTLGPAPCQGRTDQCFLTIYTERPWLEGTPPVARAPDVDPEEPWGFK